MLAHDQHSEEQNTLTASFTFCMLRVYTVPTHFLLDKAILMRREYRNNSPTTTTFGLHHTGALNN